MDEKKLKTSEAHRRANIKWQKANYSRIPLDVPKEYHVYLKGVAASAGMSLNGFIKEAIEEKCQNVKDELPPEILPNAMKWLKEHGHTDDEIIDFIKCLGNQAYAIEDSKN